MYCDNVLSALSKIYGCFRYPESRDNSEITYLLYFKTIPLHIYRVSQEERSMYWKVIVSVIPSQKMHMYMCRAISLYSPLYVRAKFHILTRVARCIVIDGGILENILY
jgi:hypothetical protein